MLEINIDFDESSKAWRNNKNYMGKGNFHYRCCYIKSNGNRCPKSTEESKGINRYTLQHAWQFERVDMVKSKYFCKKHKHRSLYMLSWE